MITLLIDSKTRDDLRALMNERVVTLGNSLRTWLKYASANKRNECRAQFDRAIDLLHLLNAATDAPPTDALPADHPRFNQPLHLPADFDPRADDPHCVHGRRFSETCERCAAPVAGVAPLAHDNN